MKKFFIVSLALAMNYMAANAFEGKAEVNGINYYIITKGAVAEVISKNSGYEGDVVIPSTIEYDGVTCTVNSIGNNAFLYESKLNSVTIPNTVTKIGTGAFTHCAKLKTVNIPNSVTTIGAQAFLRCDGLETVKTDDIESWCKMEIGNDASPLPYTQDFIIGGQKVENLVIPSTVTSICSRAFHGYKGLKTISMNSSVTSIGDYAFYQCTGLTSAILPNSITSIGVDAFYECTALSNLVLPDDLKKIPTRCFMGCSSLTSLVIPNSVELIELNAFKDCKNIKAIRIGNGLKELGLGVFNNCSELTDVYCWADIPPIVQGYHNPYSMPFYGSHVEYASLHVPESSISSYQASDVWNGFGHIVALTSDDTGIELRKDGNIPTERTCYNINGQTLNRKSRGVYILKMSDGTTKKVLVK